MQRKLSESRSKVKWNGLFSVLCTKMFGVTIEEGPRSVFREPGFARLEIRIREFIGEFLCDGVTPLSATNFSLDKAVWNLQKVDIFRTHSIFGIRSIIAIRIETKFWSG